MLFVALGQLLQLVAQKNQRKLKLLEKVKKRQKLLPQRRLLSRLLPPEDHLKLTLRRQLRRLKKPPRKQRSRSV